MIKLRNPARYAARPTRNVGKDVRCIRLTPAGHATLQAYRAKLAAEAPGEWQRVYNMIGDVRYVRIERAEREVQP